MGSLATGWVSNMGSHSTSTGTTPWYAKIEFRRDWNINAVIVRKGRKLGLEWAEKQVATGTNIVVFQPLILPDITEVFLALPERIQYVKHALETSSDPISVLIHRMSIPEQLPDLLTLSEIGRLCGFSRQRARQISLRDGFPRPVARTASGPVYAAPEISKYFRSRGREVPTQQQEEKGQHAI